MKKSNFKIVLIFVLVGFVITCNEESIQEDCLKNITLNEKGKIFMQCLQNSPNWKEHWKIVNTQDKTPLINNVIINYTPEYGIHYLLPILSSDEVVDQFAIFPMQEAMAKERVNVIVDKPQILSCSKIDNRNIVGTDVFMILSEAGITINESFIPSSLKVASRAIENNRIYVIRYKRDGANVAPWNEDSYFLGQFLTACKRVCSNWKGEYRIIIKDFEISIKFTNLTSTNYRELDQQVTTLLNSIVFSIPEIIVMPTSTSFEAYTSVYPEPPLPNNIYIETNMLIPLSIYLGGLPSNPPAYIEPTDPCANLRFRLKLKTYQDKLKELKNLLNENYEISIGFNYLGGETVQTQTTYGQPDSAYVDAPTIPVDAVAHTHYSGLRPMFSYDDLFIPYLLHQNGLIKNFETFSMILVGTEGAIFLYFNPSVYLNWAENNYQSNYWNTTALGYDMAYALGVKQNGFEGGREWVAKFLLDEKSGIYLLDLLNDNVVRRYESVNDKNNTTPNNCNE